MNNDIADSFIAAWPRYTMSLHIFIRFSFPMFMMAILCVTMISNYYYCAALTKIIRHDKKYSMLCGSIVNCLLSALVTQRTARQYNTPCRENETKMSGRHP